MKKYEFTPEDVINAESSYIKIALKRNEDDSASIGAIVQDLYINNFDKVHMLKIFCESLNIDYNDIIPLLFLAQLDSSVKEDCQNELEM